MPCALLHRALADTDVVGVASNLDLLGRITAHPEFVAGGIDTGFIARHADTLLAPAQDPTAEVLAAAALCVLERRSRHSRGARPRQVPIRIRRGMRATIGGRTSRPSASCNSPSTSTDRSSRFACGTPTRRGA